MSVTVDLEPDVCAFAQAYAGGKGISLSAAVSEIVRRAERTPEPEVKPSRLKMGPHGYLIVADNGHVITPEMVKEASEDELV